MAIRSPAYRRSVCRTHNWNPSHRHTTPSIPVRPISSGPRSDRSSLEEDSFAYSGYRHSSDSTAGEGSEEGPLPGGKLCEVGRFDVHRPQNMFALAERRVHQAYVNGVFPAE
ncbi:hypothetical protein ZHAS_00007306 [Anopheles sinensis]|uniref:Uncharacterized protein n=1 Tax=Anopheles sinensis TaxID=74873 RepID=A0A084VPN1_ANOSI|nr:hypothetical protein ZHAS_00007306 [Anopheles sinensis]